MGQDKHGAAAWLGVARRAACRPCTIWPLEDNDLHRRAAARSRRCAWVLNGPINDEAFRIYVETELIKTLKPGDIVVLDNLGSHKGAAVRDIVRAAGARLFFLPPYSPDLNPIEQLFAKLKHFMHRAARRSVEAVHNAIAETLDAITPRECQNYIENAGYKST
jgi:transposase